MKKSFIICILFLLMFNSCISLTSMWFTSYDSSHSTVKFKFNNSTGIKDKLNINGYFVEYKEDGDVRTIDEYHKLTFWEDGSLGHLQSKQSFFNGFICDIGDFYVINGYKNGVYTLQGDTIVADIFSFEPYIGGKMLYKCKFEIIDRNHLRMFYIEEFLKGKLTCSSTDVNDFYVFVACDDIPPSDVYMKKKKWMWESEADYIMYKRINTK